MHNDKICGVQARGGYITPLWSIFQKDFFLFLLQKSLKTELDIMTKIGIIVASKQSNEYLPTSW